MSFQIALVSERTTQVEEIASNDKNDQFYEYDATEIRAKYFSLAADICLTKLPKLRYVRYI